MNQILLQLAMKLNNNRKRRKTWQNAVRVMAMVVVFCTTYALILPAITMQSDAVCGKEVHKHTEECYELKQFSALVCELPQNTAVVHQHDASCKDGVDTLLCSLEERIEHIHEDSCYTQAETLSCAVTHMHGESCAVISKTLSCAYGENPEHVHADECYTDAVTYCSEPTVQDHVHDAACYQPVQELTCGREELQLHIHEADCYDAQSALVCTQPLVIAHIHSDACRNSGAQAEKEVVCGQEEHEHTDFCYPLEEDAVIGTEYHCGFAEHIHDEYCYAPDGTKTCSIPEHTHDTLCLINNLDLTADVETQEQWEATLDDVKLSGIWADDLVTVAKSQLGYMESKKNCILYQDELLGYTRYGAWYDNPYGKWDDMFVSFCLNYAEIDEELFPRESDTARWITALTEKMLFADRRTAVPAPGDLVFVDTNEDEKADFAGIIAELLPENEIRIIAGDTRNNCVAYETYALTDDGILGFGMLPENPNAQSVEKPDVTALLAALPEAAELEETLKGFQRSGDKAGFEAELKSLISRLETIGNAYNALSAEEKAQVTGAEKLTALMEVCSTVTWQELPALTMDGALISALTETSAEVVSAQTAAEEDALAGELRNQDSVRYQFTAETKAHDGESTYGDARVKVELVLPMTADRAVFDTESMEWLEESTLTTETRTIGEEKIVCQVLTGYKHLLPTEASSVVIPGSFSETVLIDVLNAAHGEKVYVLISAAMEHNDWNGTCWLHQMEEKQILQTRAFTVSNPLSADDQQANYETFRASVEALIAQQLSEEEASLAAGQMQAALDEAVASGALAQEHYVELTMMIRQELLGDLDSIAEAAIGDLYKTEVPTPKQNYTPKAENSSEPPLWPTEEPAASTFSLRRTAPTDSSVQIKEPGGTNTVDNEVSVSKIIAATSQENVFDITLQIVTQDRIETVYEDPDMAVVIVTDISNTMNSTFKNESVTRYEAAMDAAEEFLDHFQQEAGDVSRVGYVAFNTSATKIFDLQTCNTPEKAQALATEMRNDTRAIIKASNYSSAHSRFTNIEAGLKMGRDMLAGVSNKNKFIVFLSDGFPTTYVSSGYNGYDPYTSSGNKNNDGVFYDDVLNVYCKYGTSYSDTAAIRARQMATSIKNEGIDIFAIGVDVAGQTIKSYHDTSVKNAAGSEKFSTVERREDSYPNNNSLYEIGSWNDTASFKNWLKGSTTTGIGSGEGYYYDSNQSEALKNAYAEIFEKILILNGASSHLDWVVSDPMPGMGVHETEDIDFIAFWDLSGNTSLHDSITAVQDETTGFYNENTVSFDNTTKTINWDLKKSYYGAIATEDGNQYMFQLKYRIRLQNEEDAFVENKVYDTNDVTSLGYRLIEVNNGITVIGDRKYIEFPIPAVHGFLSELNFQKVDPHKNPIPGAEFTLAHNTDPNDPDACATCRGDGKTYVAIEPFTATSGENGNVQFTRIPSGHSYILTETKIPDGYTGTKNVYKVRIAYDNLTVTVTDEDGNELEWTGSVENGLFYQLPNTGSTGTSRFTFGGFALIVAAALMYICIPHRKRQKGGR